MAGAAE